jgi:membrane protein
MTILRRIWQNKWAQAIFDYTFRIDMPAVAGAMAYFVILAIIPVIIVAAAVLPYFGLTVDVALDYFKTIAPKSIYTFIVPVVKSVLGTPSPWSLSLAGLVSLWSLSRVVATLRNALNDLYQVKPKHMAVFDRFVSMAWMILVMVVLGLIIVIASVGSNILEALPISHDLVMQMEQAKLQIVIVGLFIGTGLFNWVLPAKKPRFIWVLIGTTVELVGLLILTKIFSWYVATSGSSYSFVFTIGSVILFLLWMSFVAMVGLIGNALIALLDNMYPAMSMKDPNRRHFWQRRSIE